MMRKIISGFFCLATLVPFCGALELADALCINGNRITVPSGKYMLAGKPVTVKNEFQFTVSEVPSVKIENESMVLLKAPLKEGDWNGKGQLSKLRIASITACGSLDPESVIIVRKNGSPLKEGRDYLVEKLWGRVVMGPSCTVPDKEPVLVSYISRMQRLDTVATDQSGKLLYIRGKEALIAPQPPALPGGYTVLFNVYRPYDSSAVLKEHIFVNEIDPAAVKTESTAGCIPKTLAKLKAGGPVTIVCWGDSVTVGADLENPLERYSDRLGQMLKTKFPQADITVTNISIGGTQSLFWMQGWNEKKTEGCTFSRILAAKPDLVTMEFVNDAGIPETRYQELYDRIRCNLSDIGSEQILITPHFTHPAKMGTNDLRTKDIRPYVVFLKAYSKANRIALADASARWENLYRIGLPYTTLLANGWNHPDSRGHAFFAEELMKCFEDSVPAGEK